MEEDINLTEALENVSEEPVTDEGIQIHTSPVQNVNNEDAQPDNGDDYVPETIDDAVVDEQPQQETEDNSEDQPSDEEPNESYSDDEEVSLEDEVVEETEEQLAGLPSDDIIRNFQENIVKDNEYQARFKGAEWFENARSKVVTCIGLGGIGAWGALLMSRFNPRAMYLYDLDIVEGVNISGQFYKVSQINQEKASCTRDNISEFSDYRNAFSFTADASKVNFANSDVFILGLDSMRARQDVMNRICFGTTPSLDDDTWIIEGRLSMQTLQVFCFKLRSENHRIYQRKFMFSDSEADATVCSMKQTSFMANMIGSVISNVYMSICLQEVSRFPYGVPFMIEYNCLTYQFKTYPNGEAALIGTGKR